MHACDLTCDVQRVCKKKCEALLHATSCMHARTRVRCNELHEFSESANSDTTGGVPPGGVRFRTFCKTHHPSAGRIPPPPPPPPFSDSTTPFSHFPPPKHTFAQLFYVFTQLFYVFDNFLTKFLKIFTFWHYFFIKLLKKVGIPGGTFGGVPGVGLGGVPDSGFRGGVWKHRFFNFWVWVYRDLPSAPGFGGIPGFHWEGGYPPNRSPDPLPPTPRGLGSFFIEFIKKTQLFYKIL